MIDENQIVQIRWNNTNYRWYIDKGYKLTKRGDLFECRVGDLLPHSACKIQAKCDYCGKTFETQYDTMMKGRTKIIKDSCYDCRGKKNQESNHTKRATKLYNNLITACNEKGYKLITSINDIGTIKDKIIFECPKHGNQIMMADNLIRGHECIKCSYEKRFAKNVRTDISIIINTIKSKNCILLNPNDFYDTTIRNLNIQCRCGNVFTTSYVNFSKHGVTSCFSCSCKESKGEAIIREYLEQNNIDFIQEKRFNDCRDKKPLPFDFYLPSLNSIIEFDGLHHYKELEKWSNHQKTVEHDKIKNDYCRNHNIDLLRIPYWEGHKIKEILDTYISKRYSLFSYESMRAFNATLVIAN